MDLRGVGPRFIGHQEKLSYADPSVEVTPEGVYLDIWGVGFVPNQTTIGFYMDLASSPLTEAASVDDLEAHPWPTAELWDYGHIGEQAQLASDYWIGAHSRGIFEISWFLRGFDNFLTDLVMNPELAAGVMDRVQGYLFERTRRVLEAGGGRIDMVEYNDDVGWQQGMLLDPALWREHLKPRMAAFAAMCKEAGATVRYHSCGGVRDIIPDLIEIGVDVLNPIQTLAEGMDPVAIKEEHGGAITLNGGIDTQDLLPRASADEVRGHVSRLIETLNADGGFILAPSHVFQSDVPLENIAAIYEAGLGRKLL
jgi:uroporphyrinogen decarboxylase